MSLQAMERGDLVIYGVKGEHRYIARVDEVGWVTWPATEDGWARRKIGKEADVDPSWELDAHATRCAVLLSGVTL